MADDGHDDRRWRWEGNIESAIKSIANELASLRADFHAAEGERHGRRTLWADIAKIIGICVAAAALVSFGMELWGHG